MTTVGQCTDDLTLYPECPYYNTIVENTKRIEHLKRNAKFTRAKLDELRQHMDRLLSKLHQYENELDELVPSPDELV